MNRTLIIIIFIFLFVALWLTLTPSYSLPMIDFGNETKFRIDGTIVYEGAISPRVFSQDWIPTIQIDCEPIAIYIIYQNPNLNGEIKQVRAMLHYRSHVVMVYAYRYKDIERTFYLDGMGRYVEAVIRLKDLTIEQ